MLADAALQNYPRPAASDPCAAAMTAGSAHSLSFALADER